MLINLPKTKTICLSLATATARRDNFSQTMKNLKFENWSFFDAIKGKDIAEGCAKSHIEILKSHDFSVPLLILEDDATVSGSYQEEFELHDDADALYIGYSAWAWERSRANLSTFEYETVATKNDNFYRIKRMLSTHAILYITKKYAEEAILAIDHHLNTPGTNRHCDVALGMLQEKFKVYATPKSFFYQDCKHNKVWTDVNIEA